MMHYVCTGGCNGVSDDPNATCQATDCASHKHPLTPCNCTDGKHEEVYQKAEKEEQ